MFAYLHTHVGASNLRFKIVSIFISLIPELIRYGVTKRSRPSYPRDTANRPDLTLQGGPNQHGTQKPRRTPGTNLSPPRLELQEPAQRHMVSRAQRETTKSKHMHPQFSATTRLAPGVGCGFLYFRSEAVLGLPVSTTSYSRHAVSTVQT